MKKNRVPRLNSQGLIYLGAWPLAFVAAVPQWPLHQDDGALLHRPPLTPRPPRAPLLSCLHPAVFVGPAPWSLALRAPAAGTKSAPAAAQGYRCARWRGDIRYSILKSKPHLLEPKAILIEYPL